MEKVKKLSDCARKSRAAKLLKGLKIEQATLIDHRSDENLTLVCVVKDLMSEQEIKDFQLSLNQVLMPVGVGAVILSGDIDLYYVKSQVKDDSEKLEKLGKRSDRTL